jgi:hypothetical protein
MPEYDKSIDVSSELYRTYTYGTGKSYTIHAPKLVYIMRDGSHRVVDEDGVTHRPSREWVGLSWKPKPGQPAFVA